MILAGDFGQRKRFLGFHANEHIETLFVDNESEMAGNDIHQDEIDPRLRKLIKTMITDRKTPPIRNFQVWNLYKKNLMS